MYYIYITGYVCIIMIYLKSSLGNHLGHLSFIIWELLALVLVLVYAILLRAMKMDGFISIRERVLEDRGMTFQDKVVILFVFNKFPNLHLDLTALSHALRRHARTRVVASTLNSRVQEITVNDIGRLAAYLKQISRDVSFLDFIWALRDIGCAQVADVLMLERLGTPMMSMTNCDTSNTTRALKCSEFYTTVQVQLQTGQFQNNLASLENVSLFLRKEADALRHPTSRQNAFDKLVVVTCIMVTLYNKSDDKLRVISRLQYDANRLNRHNVHGDIDTYTSDIAYCIGKCMNSRDTGKFEDAKHHLDEAKSLNTIYNNMFFKFIIWKTQALLYRTMHVRDGSMENLHESMTACHLGMTCAGQEPMDVREYWRINFVIGSASLLLRIGQACEILPGNKPTQQNVKDAKEVLAVADRQSPSWTTRREMIYKLCLARIHEDSDKDLATTKCDDAIQLTEDAAYTDNNRRNLQDYLYLLKE